MPALVPVSPAQADVRRDSFRARPGACLVLAAAALLAGRESAALAVGRVAGEFGVDALGGASYQVPITVAAGTGDLRPAVSLRYNSHGGDGLAGMGWTISGIPRIARCPLTIAVDGRVQGVRYQAGDRFCLEGQPLVLVAGSYGADGAEYRAEVDRYRRVISRGRAGSGPAWFEVREPDGTTAYYGNDDDSRIEAPGTGEVREWALNQVADPFRNQVLYTYAEDAAAGEAVPAEIRWSADAAGNGARYRLVFNWESRPADDVRGGYIAGSPWQRARRLSSVRYETDAGSGFALVHSWSLSYRSPGAGSTRRSQLGEIRQCGLSECLPPTSFRWQDGVAGYADAQAGPTDPEAGSALVGDYDGDGDADLWVPVTVGGSKKWHLRLADPAQAAVYGTAINTGVAATGPGFLIDFDGDGRRDLLTWGPTSPYRWVVYRSNGTGGFLAPFDTGIDANTNPGILPMDMDGDGLDDLVYPRSFAIYFRRGTGTGFAAEQATTVAPASSGQATTLAAMEPGIPPIDFDGDGRQDLLVKRMSFSLTGPPAYYEGFLSTGSDFVSLFTTAPATEALPLDFNGDGLTDLAYRDRVSGWQTRVSRGTSLGPPVPTGITPTAALLVRAVDYDHDGRDDLIRQLDDKTWRVHLAGAGEAPFSNSDATRYLDLAGAGPGPGTTARLSTADLTGDGYGDLLFTLKTGQWQVRRHGGPRADLLAGATDGLGNAWDTAYRSLSGFGGYVADAATTPAGTWLVRGAALPVVATTTASDGTGGTYTRTFGYANARMSRLGRGLLGFERVRVTDSRYAALHGTAVTTETTYRQDFPFIGAIDLVTTTRADGRRISLEDPTWDSRARPSAPADAAGDYHFAWIQAEKREDYETDPDGGALGQLVRTTTTTRTLDFNHGVPVTETAAVSSPDAPGAITTTTATTLDEAARTGGGCLGLALRRDVTRTLPGGTSGTRTVQASYSATTCRRLTESVGPAANPARQLVSTYGYNELGQVSSLTLGAGDGSAASRQTTYTYQPGSDRPATETALVTGEAPYVTRHAWDAGLGLELRRTDPRGRESSYTYDAFGRLRTETPVDGPTTTYAYEPCAGTCFATAGAYQVRLARADGYAASTVQDAFGRTVGRETRLPAGRIARQQVEFDALGRVKRESLPYIAGQSPGWIQRRYDPAGRLTLEDRPVSETVPSGATTRTGYSRLSSTVTDPENHATTRTSDPEGHLLSVSPPTGGTASYTYTPFGELASITDPNGTRSTFTFDERGFLTVADSPDAGRRTSTTDVFGQLVAQADAKSPASVINFAWDQLGRLVRRSDPGEGDTTWSYGGTAGPGLGLLREVANAGGYREQYEYDPSGRPARVTTTLDGTAYATDYTYDAYGRLATMTYPATVSGARPRVRYGYDATGHGTTVDQDLSGTGGLWVRLYELKDVDALGRETLATLGSASTVDEQHLYDRASLRLKEIRTGAGLGSSRQNLAFQWDRAGNLTERSDRNQGVTEQFSYDPGNRLLTAARNGAATLSLGWDAGGRIRSKSDVGTYSYGSAHPGAVTAIAGGPRGSQSFAYDANGNMSLRNGKAIDWTAYGLPRRIDYGAGDYAEFTYGPDRRRVRQVARTGTASRTTWYVAPHFEVEQEGTTRRYRSNVHANGQVVYTQVEQTAPAGFDAYFLHRDHQGSVDTLTRVVGPGADVLNLRFDAFGKRRNADWTADAADQRYGDAHFTERGYTGHEHLDNVRLVHMGGRVQDPLLGVMLSADPVMGDPARPETLNRYAYAGGNPASRSDPDGFLFGDLLHLVRRVLHGATSFVRRVIHDYGREIAAAVAAYYTNMLVSDAYMGTTGATAAVGDTLGAAAGGAVAGAVSTGSARGTLVGAFSGGAFGAVSVAYAGEFPADRVLVQASIGGVSAKLAGGEFRQGFVFAGITGAARYTYNSVVGYDTTWAAGAGAEAKGRFQYPYAGVDNIGTASRVVNPDSFFGEGGRLSRFMNHVPGINAIAGLHDVFQVELDRLGGGQFGTFMRTAFNVPGMALATAVTYPALLDGVPAVMLATD